MKRKISPREKIKMLMKELIKIRKQEENILAEMWIIVNLEERK